MIWLPIPYLVTMLFARLDFLFFHGLSASVGNVILLSFASFFLYKTATEISKNKTVGILIAVIFILNPNVIYLSLVSMPEIPSMAFFIISFYYFYQIITKSENQTKNIILSSLFLALTSLCRYEFWLLVPAFIVLASYKLYKGKAASRIILLTLLSSGGIVFWLIWNLFFFHNPFYFLTAEYYSTSWQAKFTPTNSALAGNIFKIAGIYLSVLFQIVVFPLIFAVIGIFKFCRLKSDKTYLLLYLTIPALFSIYSMFGGVAEMSYQLNSRYVFLALPFLYVFMAYGFDSTNETKQRKTGIWILISLFVLSLPLYYFKAENFIPVFADAKGGFFNARQDHAKATAFDLSKCSDNGKILFMVGSGLSHRIIMFSHLPVERIKIAGNWNNDYYNLDYLEKNFKFLVLSKDIRGDSRNLIRYWLENKSLLKTEYIISLENDFYISFKRIGS